MKCLWMKNEIGFDCIDFRNYLQSTVITAQLVFTVFGLAARESGFTIADLSFDHSASHFVAELKELG